MPEIDTWTSDHVVSWITGWWNCGQCTNFMINASNYRPHQSRNWSCKNVGRI